MPQRRALPALLFAWPARAQGVLTQGEAGYEPRPRGVAMCASCTLFIRPDQCRQVEGPVSPEGWCRLYDMVD